MLLWCWGSVWSCCKDEVPKSAFKCSKTSAVVSDFCKGCPKQLLVVVHFPGPRKLISARTLIDANILNLAW